MTDLLIPLLLIFVSVYALGKKQDVYTPLVAGAQDGLRLLFSIAPALIVLLTAVSMLRESGFFDLMSQFLAPVCSLVGIPPELVPLMLIRPFSGSAALAVGAELMREYGADSLVGRNARQLRNDVLYDRRLFWRIRHQKNTLYHSRCHCRRSHRLFYGQPQRPPLLLMLSSRNQSSSCSAPIARPAPVAGFPALSGSFLPKNYKRRMGLPCAASFFSHAAKARHRFLFLVSHVSFIFADE